MRMEEPVAQPTAVEMPRVKNPNKVKAGKISAANRKAKEIEFLDVKQRLAQLEEHKQKIRHEQTQEEAQDIAGEAPGDATSVTKEPPHSVSAMYRVDWTPWILGGLGLAAVIYMINVKPTGRAKPAAQRETVQPIQTVDPFLH
jgi:hypothetical protein